MSRLLLVGCGKMGGALARGWIDGGADPASITIVEPDDASRNAMNALGARALSTVGEISGDEDFDYVFVALKPQAIDEMLPPYRPLAERGAAFVSIAAGKTISGLEKILGTDAAIIRAMPNTPAAIGHGISVLCANKNTSAGQRDMAGRLMGAVGATEWIDDEKLMDAVTAVSGSGPAYVFALTEALAHAGVMSGLPVELAAKLARHTVGGSGALMMAGNESAETLRQNVTSPGGTTEAALDVLMGDGAMKELMTDAVGAATRRGRELAG